MEQIEQYEPEDKQLPCRICGEDFCFTVGEQLFFRERNLADPKRCPRCRTRKAEIRLELGRAEIEESERNETE